MPTHVCVYTHTVTINYRLKKGQCVIKIHMHYPIVDCITLQLTATRRNTLQHTTTHCNAQQHTATHCNTQQHIATHSNILQHTATHCNTLQHTATHNVIELNSTMSKHCNTLKHTATHNIGSDIKQPQLSGYMHWT